MAKRKYTYYQVVSDEGTTNHENYREAFGSYMTANEPATLWGVEEDGGFQHIFSKE